MAEIKTDKNTSGALDQDRTDGVQAFLLHMRRGQILAVHPWSNGHDLTLTICMSVFQQSRWSKIKRFIRWLLPNFL